ncbi:hypothetical protein ACWD3J_14165 [Streptomyces sp. NPDC002755]
MNDRLDALKNCICTPDACPPRCPCHADDEPSDPRTRDLLRAENARANAAIERETTLEEEVRKLSAQLEHMTRDRDAFRDQRNGVFKTNEQLLAEVQESDQARLLAENETRTVRRAPRTLTESEHNAAWHAFEGAAGEEGADPGTVLNAVLHALGITPPDPLAYGPTGYRCGCGKDAHSNLVPCQPLPETLIGSITIRSESIQLDNGECLRDLAVGDSVELRPDTGHEGLWIAAAFHGDYQDEITLQYAEVVTDCGNDPVIACEFSGTRHAHPVDLDGKVRPRPAAAAVSGAAGSRPA